MRSRYTSITVLAIVMCLFLGCMSRLSKKTANDSTAPEIVPKVSMSNNIASSAKVSDAPISAALEYETRTDTPIYSEEEATLSAILNLYGEALDAIENGDYSLAETRINNAAILSSDIDISSIGDESLALRYRNAFASLFQGYGRIFRDVDEINREDPLNWLDQLSATKPEDFKNGMWQDDELRQIVRKIALRCDMPIEYNDQVKKAIYFFQTVGKKTMEKWIRRSGRYMHVIEEIFDEHDLPRDLAYLAMIESGLNARIDSRTHNSGLWQFGSATGRMYGLTRTQWYDQRDDPIKSTKAAARYLNDLYKMYEDWLVVMAAYNWGPPRINRQIKKGNTDFWSMRLPRETQNYVPSFMAAVVILKAPELFGFEDIEKETPLTFDTVEVPYTSLKTAAECVGIDLETLKEMNTELIKSHTPAGQSYSLKIPVGTKDRFIAEYAKLPKEKYSPPGIDSYYVKRGDTLSDIAAKFHVSVSGLVAENGIRNRNRLHIGQRLRIPGRGTPSGKIDPGQKLKIPAAGSDTSSSSPWARVSADSTGGAGEITYIIKNHDTLYEIALKYDVSYRDIMRWNEIKNHRTIRPGQKIIIKTKG
jgi:membrane-bound lytic murein transglycosylase D